MRNTDATLIKSVEVITNPSSKYDAEAGTVINITTTRAISLGYKGSINGNYEQSVYAKYRICTAHFYKNDWLNVYGSYSFSPRKATISVALGIKVTIFFFINSMLIIKTI